MERVESMGKKGIPILADQVKNTEQGILLRYYTLPDWPVAQIIDDLFHQGAGGYGFPTQANFSFPCGVKDSSFHFFTKRAIVPSAFVANIILLSKIQFNFIGVITELTLSPIKSS